MKEHVMAGNTWVRGFFMLLFSSVLFLLAYSPVMLILMSVILFQFGFMLLTGKLNENLLTFSQGLCTYTYQILRYLTYNTDQKPFPFSKWPSE